MNEQLVEEIVERYRALGLYEKRDDGREVIKRALVADLPGDRRELDAERIEQLRARAIEAGIPEDKVRAEDGSFEDRLLTFTASDETRDRYGDVILVDGTLNGKSYKNREGKTAKGWLLKEYATNPVFIAFHQYSGIPLGTALETYTDVKGKRKRLRQVVLMDDGSGNPAAPYFTAAYKNRTIRAVSVGFMPTGWYVPADEDERKSIGLGQYGILFTEQILWEDSAVSIPANPNAGLEGKGLTSDDVRAVRRFADEVSQFSPEYAYQLRGSVHQLAAFLDLGHVATASAEATADAIANAAAPLPPEAAVIPAETPRADAPAPAPEERALALEEEAGRVRAVNEATDRLLAIVERAERAADRLEASARTIETVLEDGEAPAADPAAEGDPSSQSYERLLDVYGETAAALKSANRTA